MYRNDHSNKHTKRPTDRLMTCRYGRGRLVLSRAYIVKPKNIFGLKKPIRAPVHWSESDVSSRLNSGSLKGPTVADVHAAEVNITSLAKSAFLSLTIIHIGIGI